MDFSITSISTQEECTKLLSNANEVIASLQARQTVMNIQRNGYADDAAELLSDINALNTELQSKIDFIAIAPDGPAKLDAIEDQKSLELKLMKLNRRMSERGATALLEKEADLNKVEKELLAFTEYVGALQLRMTQLAA